MRRGRIFIYLALILIAVLVAAYFFLNKGGIFGNKGTTPTPSYSTVGIVIAGQNIPRGKLIASSDLSTINIPQTGFLPGEFNDVNLVVNQYAKFSIPQGRPIFETDVTKTAGGFSDTGSPWSALISPGMTAITIPISRLSSVGFGIRDGDHVNLIASMLLVDVDANYQSITPNLQAALLAPNSPAFWIGSGTKDAPGGALTLVAGAQNVTAQSISGLYLSQQGRVELDPNFQYPFYIVPAEAQRPRLVTQMVLQNVLVLHVGTFPLASGTESQTTTSAVPTATPVPGGTAAAATTVEKPDIITLVVTPQEAVTLTYLLNSGTQLTLTLRGPSDDISRVDTEAATLQYLLSQYRIPVPAKLPYAMQPRVDQIVSPTLPNDIVPTPVPAK